MDDPKPSAPPSPDTGEREDRRRFARANVSLPGRFITVDGRDRACVIVNISAGGALIKADALPEKGASVVLYVDNIGRFEGAVVRIKDDAFAMEFQARPRRARKVADKLMGVVNNGLHQPERRTEPRYPTNSATMLIVSTGEARPCEVSELSLTGASVDIIDRPAIGEVVQLGMMRGKVLRHERRGVVIIFTGRGDKIEDVYQQLNDRRSRSRDGGDGK